MHMSIEERKQQIIGLVDKYYYANSFLKDKSLDKFRKKTLEKFLLSNYKIEEIEQQIVIAIEKKKNKMDNDPDKTMVAMKPINETYSPEKRTFDVPVLTKTEEPTIINNNGGYANNLAVSTMSLISLTLIMIIYVLFCILF